MIKFNILNRFSGAIQFTAEIDCKDDELVSIKIGLAVKWAIKSGAYLSGADLSRAYLSGANLNGANLSRADLGDQWIIQGATRSDGYAFFFQKLKDDKEPMVKAGCRYFTLAEAKAHWIATRGNTPLGRETEIIVMGMVGMAIERGLMKVPT